MRPYRTFTKNKLGSIAYVRGATGKVTAHLTECGTKGKLIRGKNANSLYTRSFVRGKSANTKSEALKNLDVRLAQIANSILSKRTDKELLAYLRRVNFVVVFGELYHVNSDKLHDPASAYNIASGGLDKFRFYARRVLNVQEVVKEQPVTETQKAA